MSSQAHHRSPIEVDWELLESIAPEESEHSGWTAGDYSEAYGVSHNAAREHIRQLLKAGAIKAVGHRVTRDAMGFAKGRAIEYRVV